MSVVELIENIVLRDAVRERARGVVFGAQTGSKVVTFTIGDDSKLLDIAGDEYTVPPDANVIVVHPVDLSDKQLKTWRAQITGAPFKQLDRPFKRFPSLRAATKHAKKIERAAQGAIYGLENLGWRRGHVSGGRLSSMTRELEGVTAVLELEPGIYLGHGMPATEQRITKVVIKGVGPARAMSEIVRELETLAR